MSIQDIATDENPKRLQSEGLIEQELENELMLFDSSRNKAFCLNETAAFVWRNSDGETSVAEIAARLSKKVNEEAGEEVVRYALGLLQKDGLLASPQKGDAPVSTITRRDLLQKIGVGAIPMITVLFLRPPKAHASAMAPPTGPSGPASPESMGDGTTGGGKDGGFWQWLVNLFT